MILLFYKELSGQIKNEKAVLGDIGLRATGPNAARYVLKRQRANNLEQGLSKLQVSAGVVH